MPITEFLFGTEWTPLFYNKQFGVLPLVAGTALVSGIAMAVALPAGLLSAIYLSEYAPPRVRRIVKPVLEVLAGVPTVVYGYFALLFVTPLLQKFVPGLAGFNALSPGIVMGIMILPLVSSLSEDALHSVPNGLREGAYALGATRMQATAARGRAGGVLGHFGGGDPGGVARDRRDDDRRDRGGPAAAPDARSARADRDDDRLHRAGEHGRHAGRHARIPHHLRGRHAAVPGHVRAEPVQQLAAQPLPRGISVMADLQDGADLGDQLLQASGLLVMVLALGALAALLFDVLVTARAGCRGSS